jgi:metal-responsive CopG/Arc/MetJ family transcriptional regulator
MKAAISIPDATFRAADRLAKRKGITRSELYARAVAALLRDEDEAEITAQLDRVYGDQRSTLDGVLASLPGRLLDKETW